MKIGTFTIY